MNLDQFPAWIAARAITMAKGIEQAEKQTLADAKAAALKLSSGVLTPSDLVRMGHPYARRRPQNPPDPSIVNAVTGKYRAAWKTDGPAFSPAAGFVSRLYNTDRVAAYFTGTSLMVSRDPRPRIIAAIRPVRLRRVSAAVMAALKP